MGRRQFQWWFNVVDIIGVLNEQDDYTKNRNYWKYLKNKLRKENEQLVSRTNQLKSPLKTAQNYSSISMQNCEKIE